MPAKKQPAFSAPTSAEYPYVHVGHGVSAARKAWGFAVVLREPGDADALRRVRRPEPLDEIEITERLITVGASSLQTVVAAVFDEPGPRAADGEATSEQWAAFNAEVDVMLAAIHALHPIAAVIRTVDSEYSTELSPWHAWSCRELPALLPFLDATCSEAYVRHAAGLFRAWLGALPLAEQEAIIGAFTPPIRGVLRRRGGVPVAEEAPRANDPIPTPEHMLATWRALPVDGDRYAAFAAAYAHLYFANGASIGLLALYSETSDPALIVELAAAAAASPQAKWYDAYWRPALVGALTQLGRADDAAREAMLVAATLTSYGEEAWTALIGYLDAIDRSADADALHYAANRYVAGFAQKRATSRKDPERVTATLVGLLDIAQIPTALLINSTFSSLADKQHATAALGAFADTLQKEYFARQLTPT